MYVCGVNFIVSYLDWALPFLVVRGHLRLVTALQLALAPAQIVVFAAPVDRTLALVAYTGAMALGWVLAAGAVAVWALRLFRRPRVAGCARLVARHPAR